METEGTKPTPLYGQSIKIEQLHTNTNTRHQLVRQFDGTTVTNNTVFKTTLNWHRFDNSNALKPFKGQGKTLQTSAPATRGP
eukprot:5271930-Amphidinium_carterae.1